MIQCRVGLCPASDNSLKGWLAHIILRLPPIKPVCMSEYDVEIDLRLGKKSPITTKTPVMLSQVESVYK